MPQIYPLFWLLMGFLPMPVPLQPLDCFVVYRGSECVYWYWSDDPDKHNPCGEGEAYIPEMCKVPDKVG